MHQISFPPPQSNLRHAVLFLLLGGSGAALITFGFSLVGATSLAVEVAVVDELVVELLLSRFCCGADARLFASSSRVGAGDRTDLLRGETVLLLRGARSSVEISGCEVRRSGRHVAVLFFALLLAARWTRTVEFESARARPVFFTLSS